MNEPVHHLDWSEEEEKTVKEAVRVPMADLPYVVWGPVEDQAEE